MMAFTVVPPAQQVGSVTRASGASVTLTNPTGLAVGDIVIVAAAKDGSALTMGGTAVTTWNSIAIVFGGIDLAIRWGIVTNASGTITLTQTGSNAGLPILCAAYRGPTGLSLRASSAASGSSNPTETGFTKSYTCRGLLFAFANYGSAVGSSAVSGFTTLDRYDSAPAPYSNLTLGLGFESAASYVNGASITTTLTANPSYSLDVAILELT